VSLDSFFAYPFKEMPFVVLVLVIAFTVHEFAHAYAAYKFGDPTAKQLGRVTLNPVEHIHLLGLLFFVLAGFGWAKPVPVNRANFRKPRLMGIITTAVGPLSNLVLAFLGVLFVFISDEFHWLSGSTTGVNSAVFVFINYFVSMNLILFIFNLLPIPPLDGYRIIFDLSPRRAQTGLGRYEQWAFYIFLILLFIPPLRNVTLVPLFNLQYPILAGMMKLLSLMFGHSL
jgi:Zn-dependent protease